MSEMHRKLVSSLSDFFKKTEAKDATEPRPDSSSQYRPEMDEAGKHLLREMSRRLEKDMRTPVSLEQFAQLTGLSGQITPQEIMDHKLDQQLDQSEELNTFLLELKGI